MRADAGKLVRCLAAAIALAGAAGGCSAQASHPPAQASRPAARVSDPHTMAALLRIATVFNDEYDGGDYGPVYDRWDARSQAIITRADYVRRHQECPTSPQGARVEDASPGPAGAWIVTYVISGVQLHDYWFYVAGRWVFDLVLSNPDSVSLYKLTPQKYLAAVGCTR